MYETHVFVFRIYISKGNDNDREYLELLDVIKK